MVRLKPGDQIACRLKNGHVVASYADYDEIHTFEIISVDDDSYYLYVPQYLTVKDTVFIDKRNSHQLNIEARFLHENMVHILESMIYQVVRQLDGERCQICKTFCRFATSNQDDGGFICYSCRRNPYC